MLVTVGSAWIRCDSGAAMPMVAATDVSASSTGTPAAISAPKASSISSSVIGRLMPSAECRSSATRSLMAESTETSPASRTRSSGWARAIAAVRAWICWASSTVLWRWTSTRAAVRAAFHCGGVTSVTPRAPDIAVSSSRRDPGDLGGVEAAPVAGGDQDALDLVVGEAAGLRPWRRRGRTRRAGSRRRWSAWSGSGRRARRRPRRTRTRRRSRARDGMALQRAARRGSRARRLGRCRCGDMAGSSDWDFSGPVQRRHREPPEQEREHPARGWA